MRRLTNWDSFVNLKTLFHQLLIDMPYTYGDLLLITFTTLLPKVPLENSFNLKKGAAGWNTLQTKPCELETWENIFI